MRKNKREKVITVGLHVEVDISGDYKKDKDSVDHAIREFKKRVKKSGLMQELRMRESYMSPSKYKKFRADESLKRRKREEHKSRRSQS